MRTPILGRSACFALASRLFFLALLSASSGLIGQEAGNAPGGAPVPLVGGMPHSPMVLPVPANPNLPTLFLIGASSVRNGRDDGQGKGAEGQWGWGHAIADLFDPTKINVVNRAVGGLSTRTYTNNGYWKSTLALIKPGDFVIMQFGTNDSGAINDHFRARASIPGVGDEQVVIDNMMTKKREVVHSYGWYLRQFIEQARAKGATPIVCSLPPQKRWDLQGHIRRIANFIDWTRAVAQQEHIGFINLDEIVAERYDTLGHDAVMKLFPQVIPDEHEHTNRAGSLVVAECVVSGLKLLQPDPLAAYYSDQGQGIAAADPATLEAPATPELSYQFQFGAEKASPGYTLVATDAVYSKEAGYGFEPGSVTTPVTGDGGEPLHSGAVTSAKPFSFSVAVPEGNYSVTVTLGDPNAEATTTVKAEVRRLMVEHVHTDAGQFVERTFTVNVRRPQISTGGEVNLDSREWDKATNQAVTWSWDDKLTFTFSDSHPALAAIDIKKVDDAITVFVLGDSTVTDQSRGPGSSWGQMFTRWFKPEVAIANHAESGETLKGFLKERRWDKVLDSIKPGDYVLIEFGTNDSKAHGPQNMYPNQDFSETYAPADTTYRELLRRFVAAAQGAGALPVIISPSARRGEVKAPSSLGAYADAAMATAKELGIPSINLNAMGIELNAALGADAARQFNDRTHHVEYGSYLQAKCVVEGIKQDNLPLAKYIVDDFGDFDPNHPEPTPADFTLPPDPAGRPGRGPSAASAGPQAPAQ
jgi:lysophospholipase L1-like esterase